MASPLPSPRTPGRAAALVGVAAVCAAALAVALYCHARFYATHLTRDDGSGIYYLVAAALDGAHAQGVAAGLRWALFCDRYPLQPILAAALGALLPTRLWVGPLLNAPWFLGMGMALCALFYDRTRSSLAAFLLPLPPLLHVTLLTSPDRGLTNLHPDFVSYTLGTTLVCLALLSRGFRRRTPALLAGVVAALLVLGRAPTLAVVGLMLLPLVVASLRESASRRGLVLAATVALVLSGAWLWRSGAEMVRFFFYWHANPRGVIGHAGAGRLALLAWEYLSEMSGGHVASMLALAVCGWWGAEGRRGEAPPSGAGPRWLFAWMALAPLVLMLVLRSENVTYAFPASLGLYLLVLRPRGDAEHWTFPSGRRARAAGATLVLLGGVFLYRMALLHLAPAVEKDGARRVAASVGAPGDVTFTYYGRFNKVALANVLRYDLGRAAVLDGYKAPLPAGRPLVLVHEDLVWYDPAVEDVRPRVAAIVAGLRGQRGSVIVLDPEAYHPFGKVVFFPRTWPLWEMVSQAALASGGFEVQASAVPVTDVERVAVLRPRSGP